MQLLLNNQHNGPISRIVPLRDLAIEFFTTYTFQNEEKLHSYLTSRKTQIKQEITLIKEVLHD